MASKRSRLLTFLLKIINKKGILIDQLEKGDLNRFSCPKPPRRLYWIHSITKSIIMERNVFTLRPKKINTKKIILYLHGGAYVQSFVKLHWDFISDLIIKTGCSVVAPDYPLAPDATYEDCYKMVTDLYVQLLKYNDGNDLIIIGDSAGGGLALGLAQSLQMKGLPQPSHIILLSPWLDITLKNPEIEILKDKDPFLGIEGLLKAGSLYAGKTRTDHPQLSPIYGLLKWLAKISVFAGSNELLVADTRKLKALANEQGIDLNYFEYEGMFHAWMFLNLPESLKAKTQIMNLIMGQK